MKRKIKVRELIPHIELIYKAILLKFFFFFNMFLRYSMDITSALCGCFRAGFAYVLVTRQGKPFNPVRMHSPIS